MAVKASGQVTLALAASVQSTTAWYMLRASTLSKPSKPTTQTPSGWSKTEPSYSGDATKTLYAATETIYTDGSFEWSEVSVSSSYEAAKAAYNKADAAQATATKTAAYFFADGEGAHVASTDGDASTGGNLLMRPSRLAFRDGTDETLSIDAASNDITLGRSLNDVADGALGTASGHIFMGDQRNALTFLRDLRNGGKVADYSVDLTCTSPNDDASVKGTSQVAVQAIGENDVGAQVILAYNSGYANNIEGVGTEPTTSIRLCSDDLYINESKLHQRPLVKWTSLNKPISNGSINFFVKNGVATLACNFCCKNAMNAWSASQMLTTAQVAELLKYVPVDNTMKMTGFDDHKVIWTLSFGGDGNAYLWATSGNVTAGSWVTTSFMWAVG